MNTTIRLKIIGQKVQGVGLRYSINTYANSHQIVGWVRNNPEKNVVECCLQNDEQKIKQLMTWLKQNFKSIETISIDESPCEVDYEDFNIIY